MNFKDKLPGLDKIKKKAIVKGLIAAAPILLNVFLIFMAILIVVAPLINVYSNLENVKDRIDTTWNKIALVISNLGFGKQEEKFYQRINKHYELYKEIGVEIDIPLVLATLYYPYQITLDENAFAELDQLSDLIIEEGEETGETEVAKEVYKVKEKKIVELMRNMVYVEEIINECERVCTFNEEEIEVCEWNVIEPPVSRGEWRGALNKKRDFPRDIGCEPQKTYTYQLDYEKYNKYLKNEYIINAKEYNIPPALTEDELDVYLDTIITDINARGIMFNEIFLEKFNTGPYLRTILHGELSDYGVLDYLVLPLSNLYRITSCFGPRIHPISRTLSNHTGIDVVGEGSKDIYAVGDGMVVYTACLTGSYGCHIKIKHNFNNQIYYSLYAHLKSMKVKVGDVVTAGDLIGIEGATGSATGSHLHFEFRTSMGVINPSDLFSHPMLPPSGSNCF